MNAIIQILKASLTMLILAAFVSCGEDKSYIIDGIVYGGVNFEGQQVKLCPLQGATAENTDSTTIHNGKFRFEGVVDRDELCIIHVPPMLRVFIMREPIFIREPGHIRITLGERNVIKGTPLNDSLQVWYDYRLELDSIQKSIHQQMKHVDALGQVKFLDEIEKLKSERENRIRETSLRNNNLFGDYIDKFER